MGSCGAVFGSLWAFSLVLAAVDSAEWGYTGSTGVEAWVKMFPVGCTGTSQSPINILKANTVFSSKLRDFAIWYDPPKHGSNVTMENNGHTVKISFEGDFYVANGGLQDVYKTVQLHFHWGSNSSLGSEHQINGRRFPLEVHVVNYNYEKYKLYDAVKKPGGLAVLGAMFEISDKDNPELNSIIEQFKQVRDPGSMPIPIPVFSPRLLMPRNLRRYYRYSGSLTTPPCFESVIWTVFQDTIHISERQLAEFRKFLTSSKPIIQTKLETPQKIKRNIMDDFDLDHKLAQLVRHEIDFNMKGSELAEREFVAHDFGKRGLAPEYLWNNYRPVQPLNGRTVFRSFKKRGMSSRQRRVWCQECLKLHKYDVLLCLFTCMSESRSK